MAKTFSPDHIIKGNVFVLKDNASPMVRLATADCTGVEVIDNVVVGGNGRFVEGRGTAAVATGNTALPQGMPPRPAPRVPSIYEWQREQRRQGPAQE